MACWLHKVLSGICDQCQARWLLTVQWYVHLLQSSLTPCQLRETSFDGSASLAAETCLWMQDEEEKEHKRKIPKEESSDKSYYLNGKSRLELNIPNLTPETTCDSC